MLSILLANHLLANFGKYSVCISLIWRVHVTAAVSAPNTKLGAFPTNGYRAYFKVNYVQMLIDLIKKVHNMILGYLAKQQIYTLLTNTKSQLLYYAKFGWG